MLHSSVISRIGTTSVVLLYCLKAQSVHDYSGCVVNDTSIVKAPYRTIDVVYVIYHLVVAIIIFSSFYGICVGVASSKK